MLKRPEVFETYRHFKGGLYIIDNISRHTETGEDLVNYFAAEILKPGDEDVTWTRPLKNFMENVMVDGKWVPRFELQEATENAEELQRIFETSSPI